MQKLHDLRERITTLHNIRTVARTLATVSAAKLASTRRRAAGLREYTRRLREIMLEQQAFIEHRGIDLGAQSPLLREPAEVRRVAMLVLTADRGMCGAYNLAACRLAAELAQARQRAGQTVVFVLKGKKGERWFRKRGAEILEATTWQRGGIDAAEIERLLGVLVGELLRGGVQEVYATYTEFHSPLHRVPRIVRLLPIARPREVSTDLAWSHEPSFREVFDELLALFLRTQLWDVLLESYASEHGARMITMEEATERAEKAVAECETRYHRLRREAITTDLIGVLVASQVGAEVKGAPP